MSDDNGAWVPATWGETWRLIRRPVVVACVLIAAGLIWGLAW